MAYTPKTWTTGETIDKPELDAIEQGLAAAAAAADTANTGLAAKAPIASPTFTGTVSGVTKAMVGLGNVDNTADTAKPVSTAQQTALNAKLDVTTAASTYVAQSNAIDLEGVQDSVAGMFTGGTHSGISFAYDDPNGHINATVTPGSVADATTTTKGAVQLAGDLAGTAAAPTVPGLTGKLAAASNLSDVASAATARTNLGLGSAATQPTSAFDAAGAAAAVLPTQTGNSGKYLTTNGTAASWATVSSGGNAKLDLAMSAYNFGPSSLRWATSAAARSTSGGNTFHIAAIGDSTTQGSNVTTFSAIYSQVLSRQILGHGGAIRGTGMLSPDVATRTGGPATTTGLQIYTGGVAASGSYLSNGSGATLTFTATTDQFRVMYQKRATSGGTITATVDAGAVASIDTSSTGGTGVFFQTYAVTQGSHTLVLTAPTNGNGFILGVEARANGATGGTKMSVLARGGKTSTDLADSTSEGNGSSIQSITALAADLLIIDIGINDYTTQVPLATYKANIQAAITAQRAANGDVLLVGWPPNGNTGAISQSNYIQQLYDICDANNVALIDFQARWGSYAIANAAPMQYYSADPTHPNDKGHAEMGNALYAALATVGLGF